MLQSTRLLTTHVTETIVLLSIQWAKGARTHAVGKPPQWPLEGRPGGKRRVSGRLETAVSSIHSSGTAISSAIGNRTRCHGEGRRILPPSVVSAISGCPRGPGPG